LHARSRANAEAHSQEPPQQTGAQPPLCPPATSTSTQHQHQHATPTCSNQRRCPLVAAFQSLPADCLGLPLVPNKPNKLLYTLAGTPGPRGRETEGHLFHTVDDSWWLERGCMNARGDLPHLEAWVGSCAGILARSVPQHHMQHATSHVSAHEQAKHIT
jgi:hypothetical protein